MREILFRGRNEMFGWIYGFYVYTGELRHTITDLSGISYRVGSKTVGQFTGLLDKNGTKIFEGDIVRHYNKTGVGDPYSYYLGTVAWNNERLRYENKAATETYTIGTGSAYEVIGNIHENPELIEVSP